MAQLTLEPIGVIRAGAEGFYIEVRPEYRRAMAGLEGFSCLNVLWWFDRCDTPASRGKLVEQKPYREGPEVLGTFATRSPERPNPIALSCAFVTGLELETGIIRLAYIDGEDGTPVLDLKPYVPSLDRVEDPQVPHWCARWPGSVEDSGDFDWSAVFNF